MVSSTPRVDFIVTLPIVQPDMSVEGTYFPISLIVKISSRMAPINYLEKNVIDLEDSNCYAHIFQIDLEPLFVLSNKLPLPLEYEQITGANTEERFRTIMPGVLRVVS